jgi:hypothetical protein
MGLLLLFGPPPPPNPALQRPEVTVQIDFSTDLSAGLSYSEKVKADGPALYYRLQETAGTAAADASGNGVGGTWSGTVTLNQTSGKPVTGETAARYVNLGANAGLSFPVTQLQTNTRVTLKAWVYQSTLSGSAATYYRITDAPGGGDDWMLFAVRGDGKLSMTSGGNDATTAGTPISAATWYHVAVVMDVEAATYTFYVNGVAQVTNYAGGLDQPQIGFQRTGQATWSWGVATAGRTPVSRIAEPAAYSYALDSSQLSDYYNARVTIPFTGFSWTTVNDFLDDTVPITRRFGRETNTSNVTPMELSFQLLDQDRRFEVENPTSPYFPYVVPGRPVRILMESNSVTYDWAFGYIQDFPINYDDGLYATVPIVANCFLERMNQDDMNTRTLSEQLAGSRINSVLFIAGQPESMRTLDAGVNEIMAQTVDSGSPGDHAQQVARSDRGLFFFDGAGYAIFQDGNYRSSEARSVSSQGTLGPFEIEYRRPQFHSPKAMVRYIIRLRRPGGVEQQAVDATSKQRFGASVYSDELLLAQDTSMQARANDLLEDYKEPRLRVRSVEFDPLQSTGHWPHALGVKLSDRYTWQFDPLTGTSITRSVFVEGVSDSYDFRNGLYLAQWVLSLATEGAQVALASAAIASASAPSPTVVGGSSGDQTVVVSAAVAVGVAPAPSTIGGTTSTPRVGLVVAGGSNTSAVVRSAPATYTTHVPKLPVPAVFVFVNSAPPIYNAIVAGSTNQDFRMQPVTQPVGDNRQRVSTIVQR